MQSLFGETLQERLRHDSRLTAILIGLMLGISAAIIGLLLAIVGPVYTIAVMIGIALGLYVLTDLMVALYGVIAVVGWLPYATLPVKIALVPTFLDLALGGFLIVYIFQWMTGKRGKLTFLPAHGFIIVFTVFTIFSFVAGLAYGALTTSVLREFVELIIAIGMAIVLTDVARDVKTLRRIVLVLLLIGGIQAIVGIVLYVINVDTANQLLNTLSRFGYPSGDVMRYINDDPTLAKRAIGTWIDPNAFGGYLMMIAALAGVQGLSKNPVTGNRWIALIIFGLLSITLLMTVSRGAILALAAAILFAAVLRYRWILIIAVVIGVAIFILPFTANYISHFVNGFTAQDLSTQMRLGEYKDALTLIERYPIIGVGFVGTPDRDIYLGVSMLYLKIAESTGLIGLGLYLAIIAETFRYGLKRWSKLRTNPNLESLWLGFAAGLIGVLVSGIFDHYYFNIEFNAVSILFWLFIGLSLASAHLIDEQSTI